MKYTLLEMVQSILSDMDSDEVNSIDETVESEQVVRIIKDTFLNMMATRNWPLNKGFITFDAPSSAQVPTKLGIPEGVTELINFTYDKVKEGETRSRYEPVYYLHPDEFFSKTNGRNSDNANVDRQVVGEGIGTVLIMTDRAPSYWTSFDDEYIVLDAYDSTVDSTLQPSKVQSLAYKVPTWSSTDTFIPELPDEGFALLLEDSRSAAMLKLKQMPDQKAEQRSQRADAWLSRKSWTAAGGVRYPSYGRGKSNNNRYKPTPFDKNNTPPT